MAKDGKDLSLRLTQQGAALKPLGFDSVVRDWYKANGRQLTTMMGAKENADKLVVSLLHVASTNPALMQCSPESIFQCLMHSAALNLYPGPMQECAYIPFKGKATFVTQYQGLCKLAYNSGHVRSISANVVREGDTFEYQEGSQPFLKHIPLLDDDERGDVRCVWAVVETLRGTVITVKSLKFIEGIRKRAPFGSSDRSPWATDWEAMAVKTVIKQALKTIPKSSELAKALDLDNAAERPDLVTPKVVEFDTEKVVAESQGSPPEQTVVATESSEPDAS